jgi:alpha-glucosidase
MIYGAHPKSILDHPAVDLIRSIPSVWDETIALPPSDIAEMAAFARRRGDTWFLGVMNGETERSVRMPLSFIGRSKYKAMLVRDQKDDPAAVKIENSAFTRGDQLTMDMRAGGGFVARFEQSG